MFYQINIKNSESGLSLIELMVVVVILSFMVLGLVTFFSGGARSWIAGQNQLEAQREARLAMDLMVREIREANQVVNGYENGLEVSYPAALGQSNVEFELDVNDNTIKRNGNNILIDHIPNGGFTLNYYDSEGNETGDPTDASKIKLQLRVDVDQDNKNDIELDTEVNLRNYGN